MRFVKSACSGSITRRVALTFGTRKSAYSADWIIAPPLMQSNTPRSPLGGGDPARPDEEDLDAALARLEEHGFDVDDLQRAVSAVRARVQPATWKAFLLFEFFEMKAKQIAPLVSMKPAAVNQAVHRVRQLLQRAVREGQPSPSPGQEPRR